MKNIKNNLIVYVVFGILLVGSIAVITKAVYDNSNNTPAEQSTQITTSEEATSQVATEAPAKNDTSTEEQLLYLIEEEKLAHDVYTVMFEKYGAKVFGNILESESKHQSKVLTLLEARDISDPRSSEIGVFNDTELQALYDTLIAKGNKSAADAYEVGVIIEEKDIADISAQLTTATEEDVISTLESLRSGSENHLRAFNKQR